MPTVHGPSASRPAAALAALTGQGVLLAWVVFLGVKQVATSVLLLRLLHVPPNALIALAGQGLVLLAPVFALRGRSRVAALLSVDLVVSFLCLVNLVYFRQFSDLPAVAALRYVGLAAEVEGIAGALLRATDALFVVSGPLFLLLLGPRRVMAAPALPRRLVLALSAAGLALVLAVALTSRTVRNPDGVRIRVASRLGTLGYHGHDLVSYATRALRARALDREEVLSEALKLAAERTARSRSPGFGVARGLNVVVVQMESWQGFAAGHTVGGRPVTPAFDQLAAESLRFDRFYSQIAQGNTADAELLAQCSLQPIRIGAAFYEYAGTRFRCLPELLARAGYRTAVMHANDPEFWGRATTYPAIGFQDFLHLEHFPGKKIGMGTSDADFFPEAADRVAALPEPFYAVLLSLTSHAPFVARQDIPAVLPHGRHAGTTVAHYLDAVRFSDEALGRFVDRLRREGLLERTVLVVFGDHWGVSRASSNLGDYLGIPEGATPRFFLEERRVPLLVRIPGRPAGVVARAGGQVDLAPTIAALVGLEVPEALFLGRDLLDARPRIVAFPSGAALDDERLFLSGDAGAGVEGCYRLPGIEKEPRAACAALSAEADRELRVGWGLLATDQVAKAGDVRAASVQGAQGR